MMRTVSSIWLYILDVGRVAGVSDNGVSGNGLFNFEGKESYERVWGGVKGSRNEVCERGEVRGTGLSRPERERDGEWGGEV